MAAYWIDKKGKFAESRDNHIISIIANPKVFGFSLDELKETYKKYDEHFGSEGKARREIIDDAIGRGWIRVRLYPRTHWSITIARLDKRVRNVITEFAKNLIAGKYPDVRNLDKFQPVKFTAVKSRQTNKDYTLKQIADGVLLNGKKLVETLICVDEYSEFLHESSLSRVWKHARNHSVGTITAYRDARDCGDGKPYTKKENESRNVVLRAKLLKLKYSITKIKGRYIENYGKPNARLVNEESFLVVDLNDGGRLLKDLMKLGEEFDQDSITFQEDATVGYYIISTNRCPNGYPGEGKIGVKRRLGSGVFGKKGEFFSRVNGRPFVFEEVGEYFIDFNKLGISGIRGVLEWSKVDGHSSCRI